LGVSVEKKKRGECSIMREEEDQRRTWRKIYKITSKYVNFSSRSPIRLIKVDETGEIYSCMGK
jgi:hypothetical protein